MRRLSPSGPPPPPSIAAHVRTAEVVGGAVGQVAGRGACARCRQRPPPHEEVERPPLGFGGERVEPHLPGHRWEAGRRRGPPWRRARRRRPGGRGRWPRSRAAPEDLPPPAPARARARLMVMAALSGASAPTSTRAVTAASSTGGVGTPPWARARLHHRKLRSAEASRYRSAAFHPSPVGTSSTGPTRAATGSASGTRTGSCPSERNTRARVDGEGAGVSRKCSSQRSSVPPTCWLHHVQLRYLRHRTR